MSRGEVAMRLLLEMNHEVRGDCVQESIEQVHFQVSCLFEKKKASVQFLHQSKKVLEKNDKPTTFCQQ